MSHHGNVHTFAMAPTLHHKGSMMRDKLDTDKAWSVCIRGDTGGRQATGRYTIPVD